MLIERDTCTRCYKGQLSSRKRNLACVIIRTEAIVLRSVNYGETSQIVTLFTRRLGTVAVMARGARGPKSKFGSSLRPLSHIQVVFYHKSSRDVHTLSECSHLSLFQRTYSDMSRLAVGVRIIELVGTLLGRPEPDERAFDLLLEVLGRLETAEQRWTNLLPYWQLQLTVGLGFAPMIDRETVTAIDGGGGFLELVDGSISKTKPRSASRPASRRAIRALGVFVHTDLDTVMRMDLDAEALHEVVELADSYIQYHVEDYRPSRSKDVFSRIL